MRDLVQSADAFEQFVLLAVAELETAGETPAHSYHVTQTAKAHLADIDRQPFGGVERQRVISALSQLADEGLLSDQKTESPTGKGRPGYELTGDPEEVLDVLSATDEFESYIETVRSS
ncbi:hypothetical protein [Haloarcula japonica]|uniref:Orc1/cdc6 family replication initiation protein n=1 Tax=Haloarcula japonica (strain ATCC 49778 / DSM 6131 / JCM 7785 / NBRC 101032 / NCIMB 13157 / TR-1) TaxID=1227453 RepID=M0LK18_HALJT|nr:hypothetical protein [Haloarcula japonica]EMA32779.1 hypothetical protein C444_06141 [Haloarcula japonica DSM 6131]